jgi:hypothetical protein
MIKTLYYIEVLGCLSPLLTIFQLYHSARSSVLLVEENEKNHRARFELTTLVVIGTVIFSHHQVCIKKKKGGDFLGGQK